jgi:hypothetical protein
MDKPHASMADWEGTGGIMRRIMTVLVLSVLVGCVAAGGTASESIATYDDYVEVVASLTDLLERATYLAITGFSAYDAADQLVAAQELVNLFEGPGGPNYESQTTGVAAEDELGILARFESWRNADISDWPEESEETPYSQFTVYRDVSWNTEHFLRLSYVSALEALRIAYSLIGPKDAFRTSYACLLAARGGFDDPFLVAGVQSLQDLLSVPEVRTPQDESLQAAIDALPDGGTLQLESGVYREPVIITKSVTIVGKQRDDESRADGETVLEGVAWDSVISVLSDEPVNVVIENLVIRGGKTAINLFALFDQPNVTLEMRNVTLLGNSTGLWLGEGTVVTCTDCRFEDNDRAVMALAPGEGARASFTNCVFEGNGNVISANENQTFALNGCVIQNGTNLDWDISISATSSLEMRNSKLTRRTGRGIVLMDTASMTLVDSFIDTGTSYAVSVASTRTNLTDQITLGCRFFMGWSEELAGLPLGTIAGRGNTIIGGICPESLQFLIEPAPAEISVAPGQSIQAAIESVADGGVITFESGTYLVNLDIDRSLTLMGEGRVTLTPVDREMPAIRISETVGVVIQDIRIEAAATGIETMQASCQFIGCSVRTTDVGVQVVTMDSNTVRIEQCEFAGGGMGVLSLGSGAIEIKSCDFTSLGTGTMLSGMTSVMVDDCTFTDCYDSIVLLSLVQGVLSGNRIGGPGGSGIRVAALPSGVLDEMQAAAPDGSLDDLLADGTLTFINNVIQNNSMRSGISLCDTNDSEVLTFTGTLLGSGNVIDNKRLLCPVDYDWPDGFFADE